jgi:histidine triad (HIT) family protein
MPSIFTKIISGDIPCYKVGENDSCFAFLDIQPVTKGHVLVVPKKEIDYIFDVEDELLAELMTFAKVIAQKIKKTIPCNRIGISVIGLEVPHAHIHLMPINGLKDMDFTKPKLQMDSEELEALAEQIRTA